MDLKNHIERCPKCGSDEVCWEALTGDDLVEAEGEAGSKCYECFYAAACDEFLISRAQLGLTIEHCEACAGVRHSECTHDLEDEIAARQQRREEYEARKVPGGLGRVFV